MVIRQPLCKFLEKKGTLYRLVVLTVCSDMHKSFSPDFCIEATVQCRAVDSFFFPGGVPFPQAAWFSQKEKEMCMSAL